MAKYHGKVSKFTIDDVGETLRDLTAYVTDVSDDLSHDMAECTAKGDGAKTYAAGHYGGTISISGRYDDAATSGPDVVLAGLVVQDEARDFEVAYGGATGLRAMTGTAFVSAYSRSSPLAGMVDFTATLQVTGVLTHGTPAA